ADVVQAEVARGGRPAHVLEADPLGKQGLGQPDPVDVRHGEGTTGLLSSEQSQIGQPLDHLEGGAGPPGQVLRGDVFHVYPEARPTRTVSSLASTCSAEAPDLISAVASSMAEPRFIARAARTFPDWTKKATKSRSARDPRTRRSSHSVWNPAYWRLCSYWSDQNQG